MTFPNTAGYGQVQANGWPVSRVQTVESFYRQQWKNDVNLCRRTEGYRVAGSEMVWVDAAWGVIWHTADGSDGGRWRKTEAEAREHFETLRNVA